VIAETKVLTIDTPIESPVCKILFKGELLIYAHEEDDRTMTT
jgi:hypothetical protein